MLVFAQQEVSEMGQLEDSNFTTIVNLNAGWQL